MFDIDLLERSVVGRPEIRPEPEQEPRPAARRGPLLSVQDLSVAFRQGRAETPVLREVSFDIGRGETLAIVGESGSGKSVTALSVMRLLPPGRSRTEGRVLLDGTDLLGLPEPEMRSVRGGRIGMIFQEPMTSLNPVLTVGYQIAEALRAHRPISGAEARAESLRLLDRVRIPAASTRVDAFPHQLSGGTRQRVMIAMTLACRPELLIADEPTTSLDVTIQAEILALIRELQQEDGMSVLFITHDMGVVAAVADRTLVMYRGEAVETAPTARLFAKPAHSYTKALLASVPRFGSPRNRPTPASPPVPAMAAGPRDAASGGQDPVVRVSDLSVRFDVRSGPLGLVSGRIHAVEGVSFDIRGGETLALVGESGCGKSTVARALMRLADPTAGTIEVEGQDIARLGARQLRKSRRRMQIVFQDPFASLDPRQSVGSALTEPLVAHGLLSGRAARERAASLLEDVELDPDMASRFPHEFSGGQRQRICIARALALEPRVIILDEAVSALDATVKAQILALLERLQARFGLSYLFISHDMAVVERISHRIAVMESGSLVEIGPAADVLGAPRHPYTGRLLEAVLVPDPAARRRDKVRAARDIPTLVRPLDYQPPRQQWREGASGHRSQTALPAA